MKRPFVLGLTGSIGMGKSTTLALFAAQGIPVWDADAAVHALYSPGGKAVAAIAELYPDALLDDAIDRNALKSQISKDPELLGSIEQIVHPLVAADRAEFLRRHRCAETPFVVLDIPLLFETNAVADVDSVVVVTTDPKTQRDRVLQRNTMDPEQFQAILARQMPDAEKRERADFVIETNDFDTTSQAVFALIDTLKGQLDA